MQNSGKAELCGSMSGAMFPSHDGPVQGPPITRLNLKLFGFHKFFWPHNNESLRHCFAKKSMGTQRMTSGFGGHLDFVKRSQTQH